MERLDQAYPALLNFTNRNLRRFSNDQLKLAGLDLTVDQWGVIKLLDEHDGVLSMGALSERMLKDKPTLTAIVEILVRAGEVRRGEDPEDRRRTFVSLTQQGVEKVKAASSVVQRLRDDIIQGLTKKDVADLTRILERINQNIEHARTGADRG